MQQEEVRAFKCMHINLTAFAKARGGSSTLGYALKGAIIHLCTLQSEIYIHLRIPKVILSHSQRAGQKQVRSLNLLSGKYDRPHLLTHPTLGR